MALGVVEELKAAAPSLLLELSIVAMGTGQKIDAAILAVSRTHAQALYVVEDAFFDSHQTTLFKLAYKAGLPIVYGHRPLVVEGWLISYGPSAEDLFRRSGGYVDRILKGANPGDLPIEQPNKFELAVNLRTAKALGITIPESILLRADEVIR